MNIGRVHFVLQRKQAVQTKQKAEDRFQKVFESEGRKRRVNQPVPGLGVRTREKTNVTGVGLGTRSRAETLEEAKAEKNTTPSRGVLRFRLRGADKIRFAPFFVRRTRKYV